MYGDESGENICKQQNGITLTIEVFNGLGNFEALDGNRIHIPCLPCDKLHIAGQRSIGSSSLWWFDDNANGRNACVPWQKANLTGPRHKWRDVETAWNPFEFAKCNQQLQVNQTFLECHGLKVTKCCPNKNPNKWRIFIWFDTTANSYKFNHHEISFHGLRACLVCYVNLMQLLHLKSPQQRSIGNLTT